MKLVIHSSNGMEKLGAAVEDRVVDLDPAFAGLRAPFAGGSGHWAMIDFLAAGAPALDAARSFIDQAKQKRVLDSFPAIADIKLLAPVPRPGKIIGIGRNYADHAAETGVKPFEKPRLFAKVSSSVTGPGSVVRRPQGVTKLDYEAELAVVIGKRAKSVSRADALSFVAGYTILNDVSAREFQFDVSPPQTTFAKSMDGFVRWGHGS